MSDPATPTPCTTGGNVRWEPPSPAELQEQMPGYTIEKLLGRGGMGAVYKGVQSNLDRTVAIKILPPGVAQEDPSFAERFKNEARLMARLNNPAVVSVHDFGLTNGGLLYFAMEYVDGTDVSQMIRSQGKLPPEHALAITAHVCDALSAAHELGIVHRDIKPANVLINMKGQVKVADFGLAKIEEPGTHGLTKTGYAMGTPDFVAPEVLMLGSHIDGRADLYAVGVMLYQMLTGEVPRGAFKPATARLPGLDPRFDPIILKAMQSDREERYQSSTELRRDLDVILTVPLVRQDEPPTSAIPAAQVAQTPAQRSAAQKPRSAGAPTRQPPAHAGEDTRAPVPPKKSSAPILLGLGTAVAIGIGAFVMMGGGEKAKQSSPLSPLSGTSGPSTSETSKPKPIATRQTITSADASPQASPSPSTKPSNPPPATTPAQTVSSPMAVSNWQRVERTEARWKELGFEVKDGWVSFLTSPGVSQKGWVISNDIKEKVPRDVAVRVRFRKEKVGHVALNCRYDTAKPMPEAIFWDDGRFQLRNQNTPLGPVADLKEVKLAKKIAVGDEGILELAVIGRRVIARLNSSTVLEWEVPGMSSAGPFELRSGGNWIRDVEYLNLDGVADPLKALGWNVPATGTANSPTTVPAKDASQPSTGVSPPVTMTTKPAEPAPTATPKATSPPPSSSTTRSELDQRLAAIEASFQAAVERDANAAFKASMDALDKLYLGALDRALSAASQGGKLEEALALREEKQRIEKAQGVPSEVDESTQAPGKVPDTLKTLRQTYRSTTAQHEAAKAKAMQPLYDKYDQALAAVQTELTQAQKLDDALRVKALREQIAANRGGAAAPPAAANGPVAVSPPNTALAGASATPSGSTLLASKDKPFTNNLGMKFVPVPGTDVLFCIHETRHKDYAAYANEVTGVDGSWKNQHHDGIPCGHEDNHPVVGVNWQDALEFCEWLSKKEGKFYRLASDEEWSIAVGLGRMEKHGKGITPEMLNGKVDTVFPWEDNYPPKSKDKAGNYADENWHEKFLDQPWIEKYNDGYATTAPVMSFTPNKLGLYDMGGNVWELVEDWLNTAQKDRVLRGASYHSSDRGHMLASYRRSNTPGDRRYYSQGFRVVLDPRAPASTSGAATKPVTPTPAPAPAPATAVKSDFTNSLGMKFVKVPGTKVLFCIHETRTQDFKAFTAENKDFSVAGINLGGKAEAPVSAVSWDDAKTFCAWLSRKEGRVYRLPTDREWSYAVGLGRNEDKDEFPWGRRWPPPEGAGNLADTTFKASNPKAPFIEGYTDGYNGLSPVMSFQPNKLGIYDMAGNVAEWCEDLIRGADQRATRGSEGDHSDRNTLTSAFRGTYKQDSRNHGWLGFRIVLETNE